MSRQFCILWLIFFGLSLLGPISGQQLDPSTSTVTTPSIPVIRNLSLRDQAAAAEAAYIHGKYAEAADLYEKIADQAPFEPAVLYNLGTVYAKNGQRGLAIWRYLQALKLKPRDEDIRANLRVLGFAPQSVLPFPLDRMYALLTANEWTIVCAGATVLALLLAAGALLIPRGRLQRGILRKMAFAIGTLAIATWPLALAHYYEEELTQHAVVVAENSVMRTGPSASQISTYGLEPGSVVRVRERRPDGWLKISFGTGYLGYIEAARLRNL
jgi:hypothetical protein